MLKRLYAFVCSLISPHPVRLAIVRRYADANGNYVGELYLDNGHGLYGMIGASLDSLGLNADGLTPHAGEMLDTRNDFLAYMPTCTVRVGALDPVDNDKVRRMIAQMPRKNMTLVIQNGFIEQPYTSNV
jgi:hypothetical protein